MRGTCKRCFLRLKAHDGAWTLLSCGRGRCNALMTATLKMMLLCEDYCDDDGRTLMA